MNLELLGLLDAIEPRHLLEAFGTIGLFLIVFAESGLFFGFFLPGDSLLFVAGLLAAQGHLSLPVILVGCFVAAVAGDQVGYSVGRMTPDLFRRPDSRLFNQQLGESIRELVLRGPDDIDPRDEALLMAAATPGHRRVPRAGCRRGGALGGEVVDGIGTIEDVSRLARLGTRRPRELALETVRQPHARDISC